MLLHTVQSGLFLIRTRIAPALTMLGGAVLCFERRQIEAEANGAGAFR